MNNQYFALFAIFCWLSVGNAVVVPNFSISNAQVGSADFRKFLSSENASAFLQSIIPNYFHLDAIANSISLDERGVYENVTEQCLLHVGHWLTQLTNLAEAPSWVLEMVDAWAKIPEGVLSGHTMLMGDFDECLAVRANNVNISGELSAFRGKYCLNYVIPNFLPLMFQLGHCYPSSCTNDDIVIFIKQIFQTENVGQRGCETDDPVDFTGGDIAMIAVLGVLIAFCLVGTAVDVILRRKQQGQLQSKGFAIDSIIAFSFYTNTMKWLSTKSSGDNLGSIHGIRFFSTSWVVLAHTYTMVPAQPLWNFLKLTEINKESWLITVILNGTVSVDTFFTLSGLLVAYGMLKAIDKAKGKLNVPMLYLHRYLRLTPAYAFLVGIMATWFVYLRTGPQWMVMDASAEVCAKNWWHNLLYINNLWNYGEGDGMCHGETWYLANDMQFFLVSPILIYPLWKWKFLGMGIMVISTIASAVVPIIVTNEYDLIPTAIFFAPPEALDRYMSYNYSKPWMRIGPYLAGIWAGYFLYCNSKNKIRLPKFVALLGWIISTGTALAILFGVPSYFELVPEYTKASAMFYAGLHRLAWGFVISWIVIACTVGYGGWINDFLSWKVFMPLGRLSFCVYLISYQLQMLYSFSIRHAVSYDPYSTTNLFFSHMVMSFLVAFLCCITMESPFIALEKLIFEGGSTKQKTSVPRSSLPVVEKDNS